jgi:hypothetical protein
MMSVKTVHITYIKSTVYIKYYFEMHILHKHINFASYYGSLRTVSCQAYSDVQWLGKGLITSAYAPNLIIWDYWDHVLFLHT